MPSRATESLGAPGLTTVPSPFDPSSDHAECPVFDPSQSLADQIRTRADRGHAAVEIARHREAETSTIRSIFALQGRSTADMESGEG